MDGERGRGGRPRSEQARVAVLHAVDDLLLEVGYAAMTMKNIAERAGVSRMTVYRWWSTKAEILLEASAADAEEELTIEPSGDPAADLTSYLEALAHFLAHSPAGAAYRALLGEAQHDPAVAELLATRDVLGGSARAAIRGSSARAAIRGSSTPPPAHGGGSPAAERRGAPAGPEPDDLRTALLIGPVLYWVLSGRDPGALDPHALAEAFLAAAPAPPP